MPKFVLVNGIYFQDGVHPAGEVVELSDEDAKGYLERGSLKPFVEGENEESSDTATPSVEGETLKEFESEGFTYKQIQTVEGVKYTQNGVEVGEDSFTRALQFEARKENEANIAANTEAPVAPVTDGSQPSADQIAEDLKAAGV